MELSLIVRQFRVSSWTSWCKSSCAEGDMTSYGKHPTLQDTRNRVCNSFRCGAETQVFRSLVTSRVRFASVFSSLLKLILLSSNLWWRFSELDELRERSSHKPQYVGDSDDRVWYQICSILRVRTFWTTLSCNILLLSVIWENSNTEWWRLSLADQKCRWTYSPRPGILMNAHVQFGLGSLDGRGLHRTSIGHAAGHHHLWRHWSVIDVRHIGAFARVRPSREERLMSCSRCTAKYEASCFEYRREFIADVSYTKIQKMSHVIRVTDAHRRRSVDVCSDLLECDRRDWHDERTYIRNTWTIVGPDSMEDVFMVTTYSNDMTQRQRSVGRSRVMSFQSEDFHRRLGRRIPFLHVQHAFFLVPSQCMSSPRCTLICSYAVLPFKRVQTVLVFLRFFFDDALSYCDGPRSFLWRLIGSRLGRAKYVVLKLTSLMTKYNFFDYDPMSAQCGKQGTSWWFAIPCDVSELWASPAIEMYIVEVIKSFIS